MSSKKQIRRARQEKAQAEKKQTRFNPVWMFLLSIAALVVVVSVGAFFFREDHGPPPWPGAVWSSQHGHWH